MLHLPIPFWLFEKLHLLLHNFPWGFFLVLCSTSVFCLTALESFCSFHTKSFITLHIFDLVINLSLVKTQEYKNKAFDLPIYNSSKSCTFFEHLLYVRRYTRYIFSFLYQQVKLAAI